MREELITVGMSASLTGQFSGQGIQALAGAKGLEYVAQMPELLFPGVSSANHGSSSAKSISHGSYASLAVRRHRVRSVSPHWRNHDRSVE